MNLVGKILTVLILVMSLVFMAFAIAVYATHVNWRDRVINTEATRDKPLGLKHQLDRARERNKELQELQEKLEAQLTEIKKASQQATAKLQMENEEQRQLLKASEEELKTLRQSQRQAVASMEATQAASAALRKELDTLREETRKAQADRDARFKEVVALTDQLHESVNELKRLKARQLTLSADLAKAKEVLDKHGLVPEPARYSGVPPKVEGKVLATPGGGLIEISIGSDDGLQKGHRLEVYRIAGDQSTYLGRVEVMETRPDKSVCKIIPEYRKGTIRTGDDVASKLE